MTQQKREGRGSKLRFDQTGWPRRQDGGCELAPSATCHPLPMSTLDNDKQCAAHTKKRNIPCRQVPHTSEVYQQSVRTKQGNDEDGII